MKTKAVRLYGERDLRLEEFELSPIGQDGIRAKVISDSLCMSSYKAASQGGKHKRVPSDVAENPVIIGHEFCGEIIEVGEKWKDKFKPGDGFAIQPAHYYQGSLSAPGYSYKECGGDATVVNIPRETLLMDCLLKYNSDVYYYGSLAEPMSCIIGSFHAMYHTQAGSYEHKMGIKDGGKTALLAAVGPMGLGAIDYALHGDLKPSLLVVTDIDPSRLERAKRLYTPAHAETLGVRLIYVNTAGTDNPAAALMEFTEGEGYDDVFVFAPVRPVVEQADAILGSDGCLNFFAGPTDPGFSALFNFYNVHYASTHVVGTSGGNTSDMREAIELMNAKKIDPSAMITHVGGLDSVIEATLNLPNIPGGKKLIYNQISMPLTAIADFEKKGASDPLFKRLAELVAANNGLWSAEAEKYLLKNAKPIA
ncbi:MAG: Sorbitol dehydrogenase [Firmicutes bacterium ADurb.Bin182]|nr:MAG: Sorbitol dehydrogenase [Firmicutes bacterium ADurb.Bin182]